MRQMGVLRLLCRRYQARELADNPGPRGSLEWVLGAGKDLRPLGYNGPTERLVPAGVCH